MSSQFIRIAGVTGFQVDYTEPKYSEYNQQYATSSYQEAHDMFPSLIVQPDNEADVIKAVNWARDERKCAIAIKSGGHQYSGASSTKGPNIQLDMSKFTEFKVLDPTPKLPADRAQVFVGVGTLLMNFNAKLKENGLFVPHGQCSHVGVGGHCQTGGYGQLGRSFGLFADHIVLIRIVDHKGECRDLSKESVEQADRDLFHAVLGGSPGNFGVLLHIIVEVFKADSYLGTVAGPGGFKGPHAIKAYLHYTHQNLVTCLTEVAKMADNPDLARGFDLCITVYGRDSQDKATERHNLPNDPETRKHIQDKIDKVYANQPEFRKTLAENKELPPSVIIYAQWCPTSPDDKYDEKVDAWFANFRKLQGEAWAPSMFAEVDLVTPVKPGDRKFDMATMTGLWLMMTAREYELPYVKRAYSTASTTLVKDNWAEVATKRIDLIYNPKHFSEGRREGKHAELYNSVGLSVQIQPFSGKHSQYVANKNNGLSYSWRDTSVVQVLDAFYLDNPDAKKLAEEWQEENDKVMIGPNSSFSKTDRRFLWGSHGDWDMKKVWKCYYEDEAKYKKLGKVRSKADPHGTFTPNPFAVERA